MDSEDSSWIFDSLICFLNGPVWNAPLQSFIEEKSLIFEPSGKDESEYCKIHNEFKNLVDLMLGSYMEDIGITPEQFEIACNNEIDLTLPSKFHEKLFQQIWAANDFEIFKRMMIQKNIELQIQALELIEQKHGITPQSFIPHEEEFPDKIQTSPPPPSPASINDSEKEVFVEVIKQCEPDEPLSDFNPEEISKEKMFLEEKKKEFSKKSNDDMDNIASDLHKLTSVQKVVDEEEIKKRQEYLKAQRDKLVALKKQVRKKHFEIEVDKGSSSKFRPQSAKAAEKILNTGQVESQPDKLKIRKALVDRLRSEVIEKNDSVIRE